jgi:hypothetical protein
MTPTDPNSDKLIESEWYYPSRNINRVWTISEVNNINEYGNTLAICEAQRNDSDKIQIWGFDEILDAKNVKHLTIQMFGGFSNHQVTGSIKTAGDPWLPWKNFGDGPNYKVCTQTWEVDNWNSEQLIDLHVGFNPHRTGFPLHWCRIFWMRMKFAYIAE